MDIPNQRKTRRAWVARRQPLHPSLSQLLVLRLFSMKNAIQCLLRKQERGLQDIQDALETRDADGLTDNVQVDNYHLYKCSIDFLQICASGRNFMTPQNPPDTAPYIIQPDTGSSTNYERRPNRRCTSGSRRRPLYTSGVQLVLVRLFVILQNLMKKQNQLLATIQEIRNAHGRGNVTSVEQLYNLHRCRIQTLQICGSGENFITVQSRREIFVNYDDYEELYDDPDPFYDDQDTFYDEQDPFYDDQDMFQCYDDQDPFYDDQDPFYDDQDPFYDDQDIFQCYDDQDPFYDEQDLYQDYDDQYDQTHYDDYDLDYDDYQAQYYDDYEDDSTYILSEVFVTVGGSSSSESLPGLFDMSDAEQLERIGVDLTDGSLDLTDSVNLNTDLTTHDSERQGVSEFTSLPRLLSICWTAEISTGLPGPLESTGLFSNSGESAISQFSETTPSADPEFPQVTESALTSGLEKVTESAVCLTEGQPELDEGSVSQVLPAACGTPSSTGECMPKEHKISSSGLWLQNMTCLTFQFLLTFTLSGWLIRLFLCSDSQMKPTGIALQFLCYGLVTLVLPQVPSGRRGMAVAQDIVAMLRQVPSLSNFCRWVVLLAVTGFSLGISPLPVCLVLATIQWNAGQFNTLNPEVETP